MLRTIDMKTNSNNLLEEDDFIPLNINICRFVLTLTLISFTLTDIGLAYLISTIARGH